MRGCTYTAMHEYWRVRNTVRMQVVNSCIVPFVLTTVEARPYCAAIHKAVKPAGFVVTRLMEAGSWWSSSSFTMDVWPAAAATISGDMPLSRV